jgi:hypothetical protein
MYDLSIGYRISIKRITSLKHRNWAYFLLDLIPTGEMPETLIMLHT